LDSKKFFTVGVSHKKALLSVREAFSLSLHSTEALLNDAKKNGISELLVNSTCNRTELYGLAENSNDFIKLLCKFSKGKINTFNKIGYTLEGKKAINHIFRVGAGLESQILGDFEIIGQLKKSFYQSKKLEMANGFLERLINNVIQASKRVKTETRISSGATSVSYAAVQFIIKNVKNISDKNILLFGAGKIGKNTCENLIKHTKNDHIVLINRTKERAEKIAGKFKVKVKPHSELNTEIRKADVLIVATGAEHPTINKELIHCSSPLLIIDLSLPRNVVPEVIEIDQVSLVHLDELSKMTDENLMKRKKYIGKAQEIINEVASDFNTWLYQRKYAPFLNAIKTHLEKPISGSEETASKFTGQIASYLKDNPKNASATMNLLVDLFEIELEEDVKA
jgi:glutamyl-tRNA reductase|tara:strand:+ start:13545 stop:14732 length:1188 start_codon:yes stop_codon:yes gene_type:complete